MAQPLSFRWPKDLIARIDQARGLVARSAWLKDAAETKLAGEPVDVGNGGARSEAKDPLRHEPVASGSVPTTVGVKASVPRHNTSAHLPTCRCLICKPATTRNP